MKSVRRVLAWTFTILSFGGCCVFVLGASLMVAALRHNMKWKKVEADVICHNEPDSSRKICSMHYIAGGVPRRREFFRSDSVREGLLGKQKIYYSEDDPLKTSLTRDCGLGVFCGELTVLTGSIVALPGLLVCIVQRRGRTLR